MRFHMDHKYYLTHRNAEWLILTHMRLKPLRQITYSEHMEELREMLLTSRTVETIYAGPLGSEIQNIKMHSSLS